MGRIRQYVTAGPERLWTLFDSGARNTYILEEAANNLQTFNLETSEPVRLGGKMHYVKKDCRLICQIENLPIRTNARVINEIGVDEDGKKIEVLLGALAMQEWGIRLIPETEKLDLSHYPKEFIEF